MTNLRGKSLASLVVVFMAIVSTRLSAVQVKVAEGEYELRHLPSSDASASKVVATWSLVEVPSGYQLKSVIHVPNSEQRVVQIEDLSAELVPTSIGYDIYAADQQQPGATIRCQFVADTITCSGQSKGAAVIAKPFKSSGTFWFWVADLFAIDTSWLLDGMVNMAHLENGKVPVTTIDVASGEGQELEISAEPGGTLELINTEKIDIAGAKLDCRHYTFKTGDDDAIDLWLATGGLLLKYRDSNKSDFVLTHYKQYRKLIPEFGIEKQPAPGPRANR